MGQCQTLRRGLSRLVRTQFNFWTWLSHWDCWGSSSFHGKDPQSQEALQSSSEAIHSSSLSDHRRRSIREITNNKRLTSAEPASGNPQAVRIVVGASLIFSFHRVLANLNNVVRFVYEVV